MVIIKSTLTCLLILPSFLLANSNYELVKKVFGSMPLLNDKCIKKIWDKIPPRDVKADRNVQKLLSGAIYDFNSSYIILDSGHAHSIAAARVLYKNGYSPKYYFEPYIDQATSKKDIGVSIQAIAAMKFYADEYSHYPKGSKSALVLDTHRTYQIDNGYFLSIEKIISDHQGKVTWVTEGFRFYKNTYIYYQKVIDEYVKYHEYDDKTVVKNYVNNPKIQLSQFMADPYIDHDEYYGYEQYSVNVDLEKLPDGCRGWQI